MSAYTSLGKLSELSNQDFFNHSSTATFNYSMLFNHYGTQVTELSTIQHKLEVIQATTIQHPDSSNHNFKIAYSALAIGAAAIIILSCSMIRLKKAALEATLIYSAKACSSSIRETTERFKISKPTIGTIRTPEPQNGPIISEKLKFTTNAYLLEHLRSTQFCFFRFGDMNI
ncbi:hypothetical protein GQX74_010131 [Glossina fuscipes]|nr:hypothetical protein GQX74_010131 [Glossina fuscipes]